MLHILNTLKGNVDQPSSDSQDIALKDSDDPDVPPCPPVRARSSNISPAHITCPIDPQASSLPKPPKSFGVFMSAPRYPSLMLVTDEFSSQGSDRDYQATMNDENAEPNIKDIPYYAHPLPTAATGSRCKALYDYEANMYDELTIRTGNGYIKVFVYISSFSCHNILSFMFLASLIYPRNLYITDNYHKIKKYCID